VQPLAVPEGKAQQVGQADAAADEPEPKLPLEEAYALDFAVEEVDSGWAQNARHEYLPHVRRLLPASSELVSFKCRSRFCRLEVIHAGTDGHNAFLEDLFSLERGPLARVTAGFRASGPEPRASGGFTPEIFIGAPGVNIAVERD
jgi:hypothetical protein